MQQRRFAAAQQCGLTARIGACAECGVAAQQEQAAAAVAGGTVLVCYST
jgi:hypothetical protein